MIESVVPGIVRVRTWLVGERTEDPTTSLYPEENALIATAAPKRRQEFAAARVCAREALQDLGVPPAAIGKGAKGVPIFPRGVVGTLTHCEGYRAAAVALAEHVRSVGVDAEPHGPLPSGVLTVVSIPQEAAWVRAARTDAPTLHWDRLLFCAKEATYKTWFPLTGRWLGFEDAHIEVIADHIDPHEVRASGSFISRILIDPTTRDNGAALTVMHGRWQIAQGYIVAGITLLLP